MKNKILFTAAVVALLAGCANSDDYSNPDLSGMCTELNVTKQVTDITSASTSTLQQYTGNDVIEAIVTSSDKGGNFYKSISFVNTANNTGFSMPVNAYNLYNEFRPGQKVYINMKDRTFVKQHGSTVIGSYYNNASPDDLTDDGVGRLSLVTYKDIIKRSCEPINEEAIVKHISIADAKNDANLNSLIELDGVQFTDESLGKKFYDASLNSIGGATNHMIVDAAGTKVIVRVSEYATFAAQAIPSGNGKIRGVMTKYNSDYQFMIRTMDDVMLTNNRVVPLLEEPFSGAATWGNWTKFSVTGAQVWTNDTGTYGNPGGMAKMSGYSGGNKLNDDWLISPAINLSGMTSATLTFDNTSKFAGDMIEIYISTDYTSGAPSTATWTNISSQATLDAEINAYNWISSGPVNINSYTGNSNVRVAFRYTSTTAAARTWEIDNVKVVAQ